MIFNLTQTSHTLLGMGGFSKLYDLLEMYEKWFVVPNELDDMKYADQVRFIRKAVQKEPEHITGYTIFTTTDCNARCFYCYEMGRSRIPMNEETFTDNYFAF